MTESLSQSQTNMELSRYHSKNVKHLVFSLQICELKMSIMCFCLSEQVVAIDRNSAFRGKPFQELFSFSLTMFQIINQPKKKLLVLQCISVSGEH